MNNVSYYQQINLVVPGIAGGNKQIEFQFDDQSDLRYARTTGIEIYTNSNLKFARPNQVPVLPDANVVDCTLVLQTNDPDDLPDTSGKRSKGDAGRFTSTLDTVQWLPFSKLQSTFNNTTAPGVFLLPTWKNLYIIWSKCKVSISTGGLNNTSDIAIVLGVYYTFLTVEGKMINPRN